MNENTEQKEEKKFNRKPKGKTIEIRIPLDDLEKINQAKEESGEKYLATFIRNTTLGSIEKDKLKAKRIKPKMKNDIEKIKALKGLTSELNRVGKNLNQLLHDFYLDDIYNKNNIEYLRIRKTLLEVKQQQEQIRKFLQNVSKEI